MRASGALFKSSALSFLAISEGFSPYTAGTRNLSFMLTPVGTSPSYVMEFQQSLCDRRTSVALEASKKRRRRRLDSNEVSNNSVEADDEDIDSDVAMGIDMDDDLPDFDLGDKEQLPELLNVATEKKNEEAMIIEEFSETVGAEIEEVVLEDSDPLVKEAMKASKNSISYSSPKELLRSRDRNLESTFEFEEVKAPLPRPGQETSKSTSSKIVPVGGGKKRARAEARRAAAMEAAELEAANDAGPNMVNEVMGKLPFYPKAEEGEEVTAIKLLEQGTWACIYILCAWELFINSPLFDRVSPVIPVVY